MESRGRPLPEGYDVAGLPCKEKASTSRCAPEADRPLKLSRLSESALVAARLTQPSEISAATAKVSSSGSPSVSTSGSQSQSNSCPPAGYLSKRRGSDASSNSAPACTLCCAEDILVTESTPCEHMCTHTMRDSLTRELSNTNLEGTMPCNLLEKHP